MNGLLKQAIAREEELLEELKVVRQVKEFYTKTASTAAATLIPATIFSEPSHSGRVAQKGHVTAMSLIEEAVNASEGQFNHFDLKKDLDRAHPGSNVSVKQISNALYKMRERKPPKVKVAVRGVGQEPNRYEKV